MAQATAQRMIALLALRIAQDYAAAGVHEEGGNNRGDQVEFFQRLMGGAPGDSWCADFVCSCLVKAYARFHKLPEDRDKLPGYVHQAAEVLLPLSGSCRELAAAARAKGMLHSRDFTPSPGDLVLYDFPDANGDRKGYPHHVGIAIAFPEDVEGNTSGPAGGSQSDGGGVYTKTRNREDVFGFIHFA